MKPLHTMGATQQIHVLERIQGQYFSSMYMTESHNLNIKLSA